MASFSSPLHSNPARGRVRISPSRHCSRTGTITVSGGNKSVEGAYVWPCRVSGSGDIHLRLETDGGTEIDTITVSPGTDLPPCTAGSKFPFHQVSEEWPMGLGGTFPSGPHTLTNTTTYRLRVSSDPGTEYFMRCIFWEQRFQTDDAGYSPPAELVFADGDRTGSYNGGGEYTTDSGGSWSGLYHHGLASDIQFYFTLA